MAATVTEDARFFRCADCGQRGVSSLSLSGDAGSLAGMLSPAYASFRDEKHAAALTALARREGCPRCGGREFVGMGPVPPHPDRVLEGIAG